MIVQTRYRDIPWEEAVSCAAAGEEAMTSQAWETHYRGKPVLLAVPAVEARNFTCAGPFFQLAEDRRIAVCPHIALIGD